MEKAIIYIHIYEDSVNYMAWKGNKGKGSFESLEDARNSFESAFDRVNCNVETILHLHENFYD